MVGGWDSVEQGRLDLLAPFSGLEAMDQIGSCCCLPGRALMRRSERLLEYACFHRDDVKEADEGSYGGRVDPSSELATYSHKVRPSRPWL